MSRFYASLKSERPNEVTRCGRSYIQGHIRGWDVGVMVQSCNGDDRDAFDVILTHGSNGAGNVELLGRVVLSPGGRPTFLPAADALGSGVYGEPI